MPAFVRVELHEEARSEYLAAQAWYLERNPTAAVGFMSAMDAVMELLELFPASGSLWESEHLPEGHGYGVCRCAGTRLWCAT